jgi:hypothetical protein
VAQPEGLAEGVRIYSRVRNQITVALLQLPDRSVLLASVYMEGGNIAALTGTMSLLNEAIHIAQRRGGPRLDVVVTGDFNRHNKLWGGDEVLRR